MVAEETNLDKTHDYPAVYNFSLNTEKEKEELGAEKLQPKVTRAQSMNVLNGMEKIKVRNIFDYTRFRTDDYIDVFF